MLQMKPVFSMWLVYFEEELKSGHQRCGRGHRFFLSPTLFEAEFKRVFDHSIQPLEAASQLLSLKRGSRSVADYSIEFRVFAAGSGWNDSALRSAFLKGLDEQRKDELAVRNETVTLDSLIFISYSPGQLT